MEFRILGPLEVAANGGSVLLGPPKERALLGILLLHANQTVSSDRLAEELWGARPPPTAPKLVQVYVSHLRKTLAVNGGDAELRTQAPGYAIVLRPEHLDATRFATLVGQARALADSGDSSNAAAAYGDALDLWRGDVLADVALEGDARVEAERLAALRLAALEERAESKLACGGHAQLVPELESLTALFPLHERFWALLMLALYRSGRQSEALRAYRNARTTLVEQVGVEPGKELRQLERAILAHEPALEYEAPMRPAASGSAADAPQRRLGVRVALASLALAVVMAIVVAVATRSRTPEALAALETDSIGIVDAATNTLVGSIALHTKPAAIAYGGGALWVVTERDATLLAIDPHDRHVKRTIGLGASPTALAIGGRYVWVLSASARTLFQFNGRTGQPVRTVSLGGETRVGRFAGQPLPTLEATLPNPFVLAADARSAWIGYGGGVVLRVDARTGRIEQIAAGSARGVAVGAGAVWSAASFSRSVSGVGVRDLADGIWRIVPSTRSARKVISAPDVIGGLGDGLVASTDALWMIDGVRRKIVKIDAGDFRVSSLAQFHGRQRPTGLAVDADAVWTANDDATLTRIDPRSGSIVRRIPLGRAPRAAFPVAIASGGGHVWVAVH
jgi:DNA-binding SARP family transcriptional activator/sugar lactone lactonase YvrE